MEMPLLFSNQLVTALILMPAGRSPSTSAIANIEIPNTMVEESRGGDYIMKQIHSRAELVALEETVGTG